MPARTLALTLLALTAHVAAQPATESYTLDNGVRIVLVHVPGVGKVAVETFYDVGFIHDADGLPQSAHLLEHLVCRGGTASHAPDAEFQRLNAIGMTNAETLASYTHYDYIVPASEINAVIALEAERLTSLRIDDAIIAQEAPRCYQEAVFVQRARDAPLYKFAVMAAVQRWRFGHEHPRLLDGLEAAGTPAIAALHRELYTPGALTLIAVGDFDPESLRRTIDTHLGAIPARPAPPDPRIDWNALVGRHELTWDLAVPFMVIAFPPPTDPVECAALGAWGTFGGLNLSSDPRLQRLTHMILCTLHIWPPGQVPFLAVIPLRPEADPAEVERLALAGLTAAAEAGVSKLHASIMAGQIQGVAAEPPITADMLRAEVQGYLRAQAPPGMPPRDEDALLGMALANQAIKRGIMRQLLGDNPTETADRIAAMDSDAWNALIRRTLDPARAVVTIIRPARNSRE